MMVNGLSARFRSPDNRQAKRLGLAVIAILMGTFLLGGIAGMRINGSPSLPLGLYISTSDPKAPLVEFCPPEPYAVLAIRRGYRTRGTCADGATPLLKPIVAVEGDLVEVSSAGISVNGRMVPNSAPRLTDTAGRPMPVWSVRTQRVGADTVWVVSSYNARSFDSRYFGPITLRSITARLRPLVTD
jgi:conjugative transfer signal peptidase TraF